MRISSIMSRNPYSVNMDKPLQEIENAMNQMKIEHVLVKDSGKLMGIITRNQVNYFKSVFAGTKSASAKDDATLNFKAFQIMQRQPHTVKEDTKVSEALHLLCQQNIHALPVENEEGLVVGIVTSTDFLKILIKFFSFFDN